MNPIESILANLAVIQGEEAVRSACRRFCLGKVKIPLDASLEDLSDVESSISSTDSKKRGRGRPRKEKREKRPYKPRGQTSWNILVQEVLTELRGAYQRENPEASEQVVAKAVPYKIAFEEAGKRKRAADPEAQKAFEQKKVEKAAKKAEQKQNKLPPLPPSGKTSQTGRATGVSKSEDGDSQAMNDEEDEESIDQGQFTKAMEKSKGKAK